MRKVSKIVQDKYGNSFRIYLGKIEPPRPHKIVKFKTREFCIQFLQWLNCGENYWKTLLGSDIAKSDEGLFNIISTALLNGRIKIVKLEHEQSRDYEELDL